MKYIWQTNNSSNLAHLFKTYMDESPWEMYGSKSLCGLGGGIWQYVGYTSYDYQECFVCITKRAASDAN